MSKLLTKDQILANDRKKHEDMGFHDGWGTALNQLVEVAKSLM